MFDLETRTLIMGKTKCGKSFLGRKIQDLYDRKIVIDSLGEYKDEKLIVDNLTDFINELDKLYDSGSDKFTLVYKFKLGSDDEVRLDEFNQICELVFKFKCLLLVIEEAQKFCNPHKIVPWFEDLLTMGRHNKIALLMTTQKPSLIRKSIPDMCDHVLIGTIQGVNDKRYCAEFMGQDYRDFIVQPNYIFTHYHANTINTRTSDDF